MNLLKYNVYEVKMANSQGIIVQSVSRAMDILNCFEGNNTELGITEIANSLMLSKSTIYGLVNTLLTGGYLEQNKENKKYRLGIRLFELGNLVQRRMDLRNEARRYCLELAEAYKYTIHLAAHYKGEIIYIDKVDMPDAVIVYSQIGKRAPMHCTGVGKAMLAYLPSAYLDQYVFNKELIKLTDRTIISKEELIKELEKVRQQQYSIDDEEIEVGLRCVAAPILDHNGDPLAAISISAPTARLPYDIIEKAAQDVRQQAQRISYRMGYSGEG